MEENNNVPIKEGWKTTEFWTSLGTAGMGILVLLGVFTGQEANELIVISSNVIGGVMSIVPVVAYALSRGKAKQSIDPQTLIALLGNLTKVDNTTNNKP